MNKKKVLILTDYFVPHWTGIVSSLTYLIDQYKHEYDFTVLTINHTNKLPHRELYKEIPIIRAPHQLSLSRVKYSLLYIPFFISLLPSFDTVLINSPNSSILFISILARLLKKRIVIFHQGDLILTKGLMNRLIEYAFDIQTHLSCRIAHAVATYTKDYATHSRILSHYSRKLFTFLLIPKKVVNIKMNESIEKKRKDGYTIFGFGGRYVEEKGVDILLLAIQEVLIKTVRVHFYFAGDSTSYEKKDYFTPYIHLSKNITNLGLLNGPQMSSFLSSLDYLILPSRSDCFPLIQVEALQLGVPVIASNIPGLRIPIMKTQHGFLFEKENPTDLAKKILYAIAHKDEVIKYRNNIDQLLNQSIYDSTIRAFIG